MQQLQPATDEGEGLEEQIIPSDNDAPPPPSELPVEVKEETSSEPVKIVDDEIKEEKPDQRDAEPVEPLVEEPKVKEETTDDKGEVSETKEETMDNKGEVSENKDNELVKSEDGKETVSSPEMSSKRRKDKKKRKGSKGQDKSSETSRSVPKLRKRSSRSDDSGGSQG